jgi:hypothetical protein
MKSKSLGLGFEPTGEVAAVLEIKQGLAEGFNFRNSTRASAMS